MTWTLLFESNGVGKLKNAAGIIRKKARVEVYYQQ